MKDQPVQSVVTTCPCGSTHPMAPGVLAVLDQITAGLPATIAIDVVGSGKWLVPRVYIACHGIKGADVPALAEQYGWPAA